MRSLTARTATLFLLVGSLALGFQKPAETEERLPFDFQRCPCKAKLGDMAAIDLPEGTVFIDQANAPKFLEYNHNIPDGDELGIVLHIDQNWFVIYSFQDIGYVKDEEKSNLDADALLKSMRESTEAANEERRKRGWGTMTVVGWQQPPHYDNTSHNLEWTIIGQSDKGGRSINHNSRILGRKGVMSANLVTSPEDVTRDLASYRTVSSGFTFTPENRYTSFVAGDKVAEYGLTALVLGGGAAAMAKTGLLKTLLKFLAAFWKLIILGIAGLGGIISRLVRAFRTKPQEQPTETV
jgi:uncharacterized membrane-anchored protein